VNAGFAVTFAARGLRRGGRRSVLAGLCVAFGAMSLVSLQLLAAAIMGVVDVEPRLLLAGDASLERNEAPLAAGDLEALERMKAGGEISNFTATARVPAAAVKVVRTGEVCAVMRVLGVDPSRYPLLGAIALAESDDFAAALSAEGNVAVTRDLSAQFGIRRGDELLLAGIPGRGPQRVVVSGVVEHASDRRGATVYMSLGTARALVGRSDVATGAVVLWGARGTPAALAERGWKVEAPDDVVRRRARVVDLFHFMLEGTGLLGLLLGGVGVSNTMHVLLARRRLDIAVLKSIGYRRHHLLALFGVEAAMLGVAGSAAGAAAGVLVSWWFTDLFGKMGELLLEWSVDPRILLGAVVAVTATSVIFGMHAIVRASAVRPATLLRELPTPPARVAAVALYGLLVALFAALCAVVLGSIAQGVVVAVGGFAGLVALAGVLGGAFWIVVRLPVPVPPLVDLARRSLRRQTGRVVVALVALVCGIFTIGFAGATMLGGKARLDARQGTLAGRNVTVFAASEDAEAIEARLGEYGARVTSDGRPDGGPTLTAEVDPARLVERADALGREFPRSVVVGKHAINAALQRTLGSLFRFVMAVAALAIVAGAVLIANSVGLSMFERRREIGILKAIGFGVREVLFSITAEYMLLGLLAGAFGLLGVWLAIAAINRAHPQAELSLDAVQVAVILAASTAISGLSAWLVARGPSSERPLEVLRSE
jgi:putative ABC transport system permease protein